MTISKAEDEPKNYPLSLRDRQFLRCDAALDNEELQLTEWETNFLKSLKNQISRYDRELSEKQLLCLENIEEAIKHGRKSR